jgi:hypothetical protein
MDGAGNVRTGWKQTQCSPGASRTLTHLYHSSIDFAVVHNAVSAAGRMVRLNNRRRTNLSGGQLDEIKVRKDDEQRRQENQN